MEKKQYPMSADAYELYEEVGQGVSAAVHRALCVPLDEIVAIKVLDFERDNCDLNNIMREAQTLLLIDHPNVLKAHCSFVRKETLWVVMPYMAGGSCLHVMRSSFTTGLEENTIATILKDVLKALDYLHEHGHIHRDVKAGNILVDSKRGTKLGDFGVSACLFETGDRMRYRNTFVGTPCWMAPEVLEQKKGYDYKADIWSFGITALELAHGHAPFSKYPPMKVLLMTLQNPPPGLDYEKDKNRFSKNFKQMIAMCLVKDPTRRPSAKKLLKHAFFKQAKSQDYINRRLLDGLPTLGQQYQALKEKEQSLLAQKKMAANQKEELSQNEYKRGISGWNFVIEEIKTQASLFPDEDVAITQDKSPEGSIFEFELYPLADKSPENPQDKASGSNGSNAPVCTHKTKAESSNAAPTTPPTPNNNTNDNNNNNNNDKNPCLNCEEEKVKPTALQQRGRFKVPSESVDFDKEKTVASSSMQKSFSMQVLSRQPTFNSTPSVLLAQNVSPMAIHAQLQTILLNNLAQTENILSLMKQFQIEDLSPASLSSSSHSGELVSPISSSTSSEKSLLELSFEREKEYIQDIIDLRIKLLKTQEELAKLKEKHGE